VSCKEREHRLRLQSLSLCVAISVYERGTAISVYVLSPCKTLSLSLFIALVFIIQATGYWTKRLKGLLAGLLAYSTGHWTDRLNDIYIYIVI